MALPRNTLKSIIELRKENEHLQEIVNFLRRENFEYTLKVNRMENIISNVGSIAKENPGQLVEASEYLCRIIQSCNGVRAQSGSSSITSKDSTLIKATPASTLPAKPHVVKPHMVNGHILYIPTINLTRVSESQTRLKNESNSQRRENSLNESSRSSGPAVQSNSTDTTESEANNSTQEFHNSSQISHLEDVSEASSSKSPSHSTVLSGTFQEVKIYLNQVSQDSDNLTSRQSQRSSPRRKRHSGSTSFITKRNNRRQVDS